jgi:hypothetical protein
MIEIFNSSPFFISFLAFSLIALFVVWVYLVWGGYHLFAKNIFKDFKERQEIRKLIKKSEDRNKRLTKFSVLWSEQNENRFQELLVFEEKKMKEGIKNILDDSLDKKALQSAIDYELFTLTTTRDIHIKYLEVD